MICTGTKDEAVWEEEEAGADEADDELENDFDTDSEQEDYSSSQIVILRFCCGKILGSKAQPNFSTKLPPKDRFSLKNRVPYNPIPSVVTVIQFNIHSVTETQTPLLSCGIILQI